ncbi:MAG TPA: hypothetical protein VHG08_02345, partial [Longimicrobium sp.]|nr:hypothetical protein [Longimicrobium sp.]
SGGPAAVEGVGDEPPGAWDQGWDDAADGIDVQPIHLWGGPWLPPRTWLRWRRRHWFPRFARMVRTARPVGTLRARSGARYPVYRGRMGGRTFRMVARPRGRMRYEVMAMEEETGGPGQEMGMQGEAGGEGELLAMGGSGASTSAGFNPPQPPGGYRLRLPHAGIHAILGRLRPEQLRRLAGGTLPADPAAAVTRGVGRIARRARRLGRFRGTGAGPRLDVFATPGFRLLVRPTGEMEGEILSVAPVQGEMEEEAKRSVIGTMTWYGPFRFIPTGGVVLTSLPKGPPVPAAVDGKGVYLIEKRGNGGFQPVYVGKADPSFTVRLKERRDHLRQTRVDLARYRVFLGVPANAAKLTKPDILDLEHAVIRSVLRGLAKASPKATDKPTAHAVPTTPLTNINPRHPIEVIAPGLRLIHRKARGAHVRPWYLRSGIGSAGEYYEVGE